MTRTMRAMRTDRTTPARALGAALGALLCLGLAAAPAGAASFTLDELVDDGDSFSAGGLVFSDFDATVSGSLPTLLSSYVVEVDESGFTLTGPIGAADGEVGDVRLEYNVATTGPGTFLSGGQLLFVGAASGVGAQANVAELYVEQNTSAFVFATGGGGENFVDSVAFTGAPTSLRVIKDIQVDSLLFSPGEASLGGVASVSVVEQSFTVVPEPQTLAMMGLGLAGLAAAGSRRRGRARS